MKIVLTNGTKAIDVVKRMTYLAYSACGGAVGMGMFQEMRLGGKNAQEEEVWRCAYNAEDYPGGRSICCMPENGVHCDYVFGRMMKWGCRWTDSEIILRDQTFTPDYQSFCRTYPDNKSLATAALESLGVAEFEFV